MESEVVIYQAADGRTKVDVRFQDENVWLTQQQIASLYGKAVSTINEHLNNIFEEEELDRSVSEHKFGNSEFMQKAPFYYNLDVIIAVGYRVKSPQGTLFRKWATERLKEYLIKGFTMDDARLKELGGGRYWYELLNRIKDIRSSEKVLYRQVLDLYATSVDYDPSAEESVRFFKIVQNKLHFAAHGHTAAEVIYERANADEPFMGLKTFAGTFPVKSDITVAKNYLDEKELKILNNLVSGYFDFAEIQAMEHRPMYMQDYIRQLDNTLSSTGRPLLSDAGSISHKQAETKAIEEYRKFQVKELSPVEKAYMESIKQLGRKK